MATPLFTDAKLCADLTPLIVGNSGDASIKATGIPPHIELYKQIDAAKSAIDSIPSKVVEGVEKIIEEKWITAGYYLI